MKKVRFIINPKSGTGEKKSLPRLIDSLIDKGEFDTEICFTKAAGHATELAREAADKKYEIVVSVGGDGSVNETAASLIHTETALGIIPMGSGNGLARHMKIPVDAEKAIALINAGRRELIDTLSVNGRFCIGTFGCGFDGHIAHLFAHAPKRGYSTYAKLVLKEFSSYGSRNFTVEADGRRFDKNCFLMTIANSSQFGNDAVIAPGADIHDGLINVTFIKPFPVLAAPLLIYRLMHHSINKSKYFESLTGKRIIIKNTGKLEAHIDGEPVLLEGEISVTIYPMSLAVIVPGH